MTNKSYIPILAVFGAIMLAVMAAIAPSQSFLGPDVVYAQTPDDASLRALTVGNLNLIPDPTGTNVLSSTLMYTARAPSGTDLVTVTATPNNSNARVDITPGDATSVTPDTHEVALGGGRNTVIRVKVTSEDTTASLTYTVMVYQERTNRSDVDTLSSLSLSGVRLSPSFTSARGEYRGRAVYGTTKTTVSYRATDIGATVRISDESTTVGIPETDARTDNDSATPGHQVDLDPGDNTVIYLVVTPENTTGGTPKNYKITIYRENFVKSNNALLSDEDPVGLILTGNNNTALGEAQEFEYAPTEKSYSTVSVANGISQVTVSASTDHPGAMAVITPSDQRPDAGNTGHQVLLRAGAKTDITVVVTAEDGTTTETYSVTIYRTRRAGTLSDVNTLSSLSLSGVRLSPSFASARGDYSVRAAYDTTETTVSYSATDAGATVRISDESTTTVDTPETDARMDDDSATPGHQVDLDPGDNTVIYLVVTPEDTADGAAKNYKITIYRENFVKSNNALLSDDAPVGLILTGNNNTALDEAQEFEYALTKKSYPTVSVANEISQVTVSASTDHPGAMAVITPSDQNPDDSGHQVFLNPGAKTDITVVVTAEDGTTTETYSVTIYRTRRAGTLSDVNTLSSLSLSDVTLEPSFASARAITAQGWYTTPIRSPCPT